MAILGNRKGGNPIVINSDGSRTIPRRIPLNEKKFEEGWLQGLIESNPELLPVAEIEPAFAPLVSIGREVETSAGYIDNLFLSPQGYLTIVETKLWRNPGARREVVAQIIDYAAQLSHWSYELLENKVREYNKQHRGSELGIIDSIRLIEDVEEGEGQTVVDTISRNLQRGRFLLLVVGDGIREDVESMADFLQQTPQLHFTLALVELQVYEAEAGGNKSLLVIPQIVARTREITRAVVRVEGKAIESVHVEVDTEIRTEKVERKLGMRFTLTEEDYFDSLSRHVDSKDVDFARELKEDMEKRGCIIDWKQGSFVVKFPDPGGSGEQLSMLVVPTHGHPNIRAELRDQLGRIGLPEQIAFDYFRESSELFGGNERILKFRGVTLKELRQQYGGFAAVVQKTIDKIKEASSKQ